MNITKDTTFGELENIEGFADCLRYFNFEETATPENLKDISLSKIENGLPGVKDGVLMGLRNPAFDGDYALKGLQTLQKTLQGQDKVIYNVYDSHEIQKNPELEDVKLFYFPGDAKKPFVLACAGGAYQSVCSLTEGLPLAAKATELGYTTFVLNYRVHCNNLFPRPMQDLARALDLIINGDIFDGFRKDQYAVAGFSAGGHLAAEWGTDNLGYKKYDLPAPAVLMLAYPATDLNLQLPEHKGWFYPSVFGNDYTQDDIDTYSVNLHMDKNYPPVYLAACRDDNMVSFENSEVLVRRMKELSVPYRTRFEEHGGHGFALGTGTAMEGWFDEAVLFWEKIRKGE